MIEVTVTVVREQLLVRPPQLLLVGAVFGFGVGFGACVFAVFLAALVHLVGS